MSSVNISLTEEAYNYLKMLKSHDKSFSDVIIEMKSKESKGYDNTKLLRFFGALKGKSINWEDRHKKMREFRDSFNRRMDETVKLIQKARGK